MEQATCRHLASRCGNKGTRPTSPRVARSTHISRCNPSQGVESGGGPPGVPSLLRALPLVRGGQNNFALFHRYSTNLGPPKGLPESGPVPFGPPGPILAIVNLGREGHSNLGHRYP